MFYVYYKLNYYYLILDIDLFNFLNFDVNHNYKYSKYIK